MRTLEDQIDGTIHNPSEMGTSWVAIADKLAQDHALVAEINDLYPTSLRSET